MAEGIARTMAACAARGAITQERDIGTPRSHGYSIINKFVSSGARLAGKRMVSCDPVN
jgi:hypothetical protein